MPVKRRLIKTRVTEISDTARAFFMDEPVPPGPELHMLRFGMFDHVSKATAADLWIRHREELLAEWIDGSPGCRPQVWWRYDAPRASDRFLLELGIQRDWADFMADPRKIFEPRQRRRPDGTFYTPNVWARAEELGRPDVDRDEHGAVIVSEAPFFFESQAAYLRRHDLLMPGEARRLKAEDFEPEIINIDELELLELLANAEVSNEAN